MAQLTFKITKRHADDIVYKQRRFDFRPIDKNVTVGDIVRYVVIHNTREIDHPILNRRYKVIYTDNNDVRVANHLTAFGFSEIKSVWG